MRLLRALRRLDRKKLFGPFCRKEMQHERRDERQHRGRSRDTQPQTAQRTPPPNLPPQRIERSGVGRRNMVAPPTALPLPHLREALRISVQSHTRSHSSSAVIVPSKNRRAISLIGSFIARVSLLVLNLITTQRAFTQPALSKKTLLRHFVRSFAPAAPIFITTPVRRPSRQFPIFATARHKE